MPRRDRLILEILFAANPNVTFESIYVLFLFLNYLTVFHFVLFTDELILKLITEAYCFFITTITKKHIFPSKNKINLINDIRL